MNYAYIDNSYHDAFSNIMMSSLCVKFKSDLSNEDFETCDKILNGSPGQGMTQSLTHFVEGLIFINNLYENYKQNPDAAYFWNKEEYIVMTGNNQEDNTLNLLRSVLSEGICKIIIVFEIFDIFF